jgi:hypothetical protein
LPPVFSSNRIDSIVIRLSKALVMS